MSEQVQTFHLKPFADQSLRTMRIRDPEGYRTVRDFLWVNTDIPLNTIQDLCGEPRQNEEVNR